MPKYDHTRGRNVGQNVFDGRRVRGMSEKQAEYIDRLLTERIHDLPYAAAAQVNVRHASRIIAHLLSLPKREGVPERPASPRAVEYARTLVTIKDGGEQYADVNLATAPHSLVSRIIEELRIKPMKTCSLPVGAYKHDGVIYSVRATIENERKFAVHAVQVGDGWGWSPRDYDLPFRIDPASRLTLKEAIEFGAQTGRCVHCGRALTDPKSIVAGMGKVCASRYE